MTTDPAVTAAAEALSIIGGVPDIWDLRAAGIAVAAARPIIEAEVRERIAADIEARIYANPLTTQERWQASGLMAAARIARGQSPAEDPDQDRLDLARYENRF